MRARADSGSSVASEEGDAEEHAPLADDADDDRRKKEQFPSIFIA